MCVCFGYVFLLELAININQYIYDYLSNLKIDIIKFILAMFILINIFSNDFFFFK